MTQLKIITKVWGFEGCGAMWTFRSDENEALRSAGENPVQEFLVEEAFQLDNQRRQELGFDRITFQQFVDCIDTSGKCSIFDDECA